MIPGDVPIWILAPCWAKDLPLVLAVLDASLYIRVRGFDEPA